MSLIPPSPRFSQTSHWSRLHPPLQTNYVQIRTRSRSHLASHKSLGSSPQVEIAHVPTLPHQRWRVCFTLTRTGRHWHMLKHNTFTAASHKMCLNHSLTHKHGLLYRCNNANPTSSFYFRILIFCFLSVSVSVLQCSDTDGVCPLRCDSFVSIYLTVCLIHSECEHSSKSILRYCTKLQKGHV